MFPRSAPEPAHVKLKRDLARSRGTAQPESRSQCGMTGKGQLFLHGENSHPHPRSRSTACSRGRRRCLRQIHLASHSLHLLVAEPRPSGNTARGLPSNGREEKTSNCTKAKRRDLWYATYCSPSCSASRQPVVPAAGAQRATSATSGLTPFQPPRILITYAPVLTSVALCCCRQTPGADSVDRFPGAHRPKSGGFRF